MALVRKWYWSAALLALLAGGTVHAQTLGMVEQRLNRLEDNVRKLEKRRAPKDIAMSPAPAQSAVPTPPASALIDLSNRLTTVERLAASLLAGQELDRRNLAVGLEQLQRLKGDVELRLDANERQVAALTAALAATPKAAQVVEPVKPMSADDRFIEALGFAQKDEWSKAEFAFDTFITNNPSHTRLIEARYWLGRSFQGQGKPAKAAQIFLELYEKYPTAPIALDNLFALAQALIDLGPDSTAQACAVYDQIDAGFDGKLTTGQHNLLLDARLKLNCTG